MYLKPEDTETNDPPIIVKSIKIKDIWKFEEYIAIPDVEIEDVTAKNIGLIPSEGIIKK